MRHLLTTLFLICFLSYSNAQNKDYDSYDDDIIVVSLVEADGADVKCSLFTNNSKQPQDAIDALIKEGRYIKSVTNTRFGVLVVHEPNTKNIPQHFTVIPSYKIKKEIKNYFKEKMAIRYYNNQCGYALFDVNPEVTRQSNVEIKVWKKGCNDKVAKLNAKGEYLTIIGLGEFYAQNGHGDNIEQCYKSFIQRDVDVQDAITQYINEGWVVSGVTKAYNRYGNFSFFHILFDRQKDPNRIKQKILLLSTKGGVDEFKKSINEGYRIDNIWCGWENEDYAALDASIESYRNSSSDWLEILGGITSSASQLFGGNTNNSSYEESGNDVSTGSSGGSSSKAASKNGVSKSNHANWRSLDQSYSNYESQLIRISNSSNIDKQEVRSIQRKMRDIREKIRVQSGGHQRAVSQWENWNP